MGCGSSTAGREPSSTRISIGAEREGEEQQQEGLSREEKEQIERIKSNRKPQQLLATDHSMDHYRVATFQISDNDAYFPAPDSLKVKCSPSNAERRSSLRKSPSNSPMEKKRSMSRSFECGSSLQSPNGVKEKSMTENNDSFNLSCGSDHGGGSPKRRVAFPKTV